MSGSNTLKFIENYKNELCLYYKKPEDKVQCIFTKRLSSVTFNSILVKLNVMDIYSQLEGECCDRELNMYPK